MANYSLIHIPTNELPLVLKEIRRVLQKDGLLLILSMKGEKDHLVDEPMLPNAKIFINLFNLERLTKILKRAKFTIVYHKETKVVDLDGSLTEGVSVIAQKSVN